ncbi:hypothetical protein, partial [Caballeronia sp. INML1]|uniref:hypothetical protein n=1 Tax=Caballeronia sp. INML1 TaxID=2921760 RepID=UPI0020277EA6
FCFFEVFHDSILSGVKVSGKPGALHNRYRATPDLAESVTFPKSAVTFAEIRTAATCAPDTAQKTDFGRQM